jgi:hypothetical protein
MFDANETIESKAISDFISTCSLHDLHSRTPAKTTCHSSTAGRIDFMLGTSAVVSSIIQSGTLSYAEGLTSDHRGLFLDIDYPELLQLDTVNEIIPSAGRILRSGNPEMQDRYNETVTAYLTKHNAFQRLDKIITASGRISKKRIRRLLNALDADIGRAMASGENSLRTPVQKYHFSPTLRTCGLLQQYWRNRFQDHYQDCTSERTYQTIEDEMKRYQPEYQLPFRHEAITIDRIRQEFSAATGALRAAQRNAGPLRYQFQTELMERYRAEGDLARMRIVERSIKAEHVRAMFRKIGFDMKPQARSSVNHILTPHHPDPKQDARLSSQCQQLIWEEKTFFQLRNEIALVGWAQLTSCQAH